MGLNILKVFGLSSFAFFVGVFLTPALTHYLYKYKMWKKRVRTQALSGGETTITQTLESQQQETRTPRMGGILIWLSTLIVIFLFYVVSVLFSHNLAGKLNFLSRGQTWLPLFTLISASLVGLVDDILTIYGKGKYMAGGISLKIRVLIVAIIGLIGAYWFYSKLEINSIHIPFWGDLSLGLFFIPLFILVMLILFGSSVIDGIDGLSGGVFAAIFAAYSGIAFFQNQIDLATFCGVMMGGILAFLWFNIPPARFYMGETGILGLVTTLTVVAFLTKSVVVLPLIALPLFATVTGNVIQMISKKFFHRKVFKVAPIHHHFEALGWSSAKVVMRYWIISIICAVTGMVLVLVG